MPQYIPTGQAWINQWFRAKAVRKGGIIRRSIQDIKKFASPRLVTEEVKRRKFHMILCGGQCIILCNSGAMRVIR